MFTWLKKRNKIAIEDLLLGLELSKAKRLLAECAVIRQTIDNLIKQHELLLAEASELLDEV